jgi:hypothetical protein
MFLYSERIYNKYKIMLKETQIKIGEKEYLIKKSYRSLLMFEEETGKAITEMQQTLKDLLMLFYCIVKANNKVEMSFLEFVELIDENQESMDKFNKYLVDSMSVLEEPQQVKKKRTSRLK